jgi:hypothetical protein
MASQEKYEFPDTVARYLKVTVNGNSVNNWASITEFDSNGYLALGLPVVTDDLDTSPLVQNNVPSGGLDVGVTSVVNWIAMDASGNSASAQQSVIVGDTTPPIVSALPKGGIYSTVQTISLLSEPGATIYYTTDGSTPTTSSTTYNGPISITISKTLKFFAKDEAGNISEISVEVYTVNDISKPSISITSPTSGIVLTSSYSSLPLVISGTASDSQSGVQRVEVRIRDPDGITTPYQLATPNLGGWSSWSSERSITKAGLYTINARVTDYAGNQNWVQPITFSVTFVSTNDNTKPLIKITSPENGGTFSGQISTGILVSIDGIASDLGSGIQKVEVRVMSPMINSSYKVATPLVANDWSAWMYDHVFTTSGTYTFSARATDKAGNMQWSTIQVTINLT